jgi:hypothetical protein
MLIGASCVPNVHNGFYYFINGFHAVFENYGSETRACMGFVIAGFVIAYIPFICVLPVFYFFLANFIIFEVLSEKFQNVTFVKYRKWAYFIHFAEIAVLGLVIPGIILLTAGYSPFYYPSLFGAFGNLIQILDRLITYQIPWIFSHVLFRRECKKLMIEGYQLPFLKIKTPNPVHQ